MPDPVDMLQYLWLVALTLLICLFGVVLVMVVRVLLRLRWQPPRSEAEPTRRHRARRADPWKESAERLVVPLPRTDPKDRDDHDDTDEAPHDPEQ